MPDFSINFEVYCATCGAGLCGQSNGSNDRRGPRVDVEACENCVETARAEGHTAGYEEAEEELERHNQPVQRTSR